MKTNTYDNSHLHRATLNPRTVKQMQMNSNTRREKNAERQKALALPKFKEKKDD
jgi:hypothetical protein